MIIEQWTSLNIVFSGTNWQINCSYYQILLSRCHILGHKYEPRVRIKIWKFVELFECQERVGFSLEHWFVNQYGGRPFVVKYLFSLLHICVFVCYLSSHRTADQIVAVFFRTVNTVVEVNQYHPCILFFDKLLTSQRCI